MKWSVMAVDVIPHNKGTKKLFENKILEKLTRTHIAIPIGLFIVYSGGLLYYNISSIGSLTIWQTTGLFFAGFFTFTLVEYLMHRYLFHIGTSRIFCCTWKKIESANWKRHLMWPKMNRGRSRWSTQMCIRFNSIATIMHDRSREASNYFAGHWSFG